MENIEAIAVIIGLVNGARLLSPEKVTGFIAFCLALVLGVVFGALGWFGLTGVEAGIVAALVSSGLYTVAKRIGGQ